MRQIRVEVVTAFCGKLSFKENKMGTIFEYIWIWINNAYLFVSGFSTDVTDRVRAYVRGFVGMILGMTTLLVLAIAMNNKTLSIISAILASSLFLLPGLTGRLLNWISKKAKIDETDFKALFSPFMTVSLFLATISVWISANGTESLHSEKALVGLVACFFVSIAIAYFESTKKYAGYVMTFAVCMILLSYFAPDTWRVWTRFYESSKAYVYAILDRSSRNKQADAIATFATVIQEGKVFEIDSVKKDGKEVFSYNVVELETIKKAENGEEQKDSKGNSVREKKTLDLRVGTKVMIHSVKNDYQDEGTEPMEEISLPDKYGVFSGGKRFYFPKSMLGEYKVVRDYNRAGVISTTNTTATPTPSRELGQVELHHGETLEYTLAKGEMTPWIKVGSGIMYNIHRNKDLRAYFTNGTVVSLPGDKNTEIPRICPTTMRLAMVDDGSDTVIITGI